MSGTEEKREEWGRKKEGAMEEEGGMSGEDGKEEKLSMERTERTGGV